MRKTILATFLLAGTTFGFANNLSKSSIVVKTTSEKSVIKKKLNIDSVSYDESGKCTVKASYNNGTTSGTITITANTCSQAMATITLMLGNSGL